MKKRNIVILCWVIFWSAWTVFFAHHVLNQKSEPILSLSFRPLAPEIVVTPIAPRNYRQSVIPFGIESIAQLNRMIQDDPKLAELYRGFDLETAHFERIDGCIVGFVSYRTARGLFYKSKPSVICNEIVLVDQYQNMIRVKCGNRIRVEQQPPVDTDPEPTDTELETPTPDSTDLPQLATQTFDIDVPTVPPTKDTPIVIDGWVPPPCPMCGIYPPIHPSTPTPEPSTLLILGLGAGLLIFRRKRLAR